MRGFSQETAETSSASPLAGAAAGTSLSGMSRHSTLLCAILCACAAFAGEDVSSQPARKPLFNGKDLDGWVAPADSNAWKVEQKLLLGASAGGAWLRTEKEYADFTLNFEYRLQAGANSGVSLRCPAKGDPAHDGVEIQLLDDAYPAYKNVEPAQRTGAIYMQVPARLRAAHPAGEWNTCEIACRGSEIVVSLNGVEVNRVNLNAERTGRDGRTPLRERPRSGFIALEARAGEVAFRKLEIRKL